MVINDFPILSFHSYIGVGVPRSCMKDESRSLGAGLQEQASNHLKLHWLRVIVVSVKEKAWQKTVSGVSQGDECK